jgi:hypothetical protein
MIRRMNLIVVLALGAAASYAQTPKPFQILLDSKSATEELKTTPSLQVVVNPLLRRGSPIHDEAFKSLKDTGADYVRYVPWHPYPRLAVAELEPPSDGKTSWDLSLIDPMTVDFLNATAGHSVILNFSTIPAWLYSTNKKIEVPTDPNQVYWDYTQGNSLRDPSRKQLTDYYTRLVSWYTQGGFTDEAGKRHESNYHYKIPWWEVFNEIDVEHQPSPEEYAANYDAIVASLHALNPSMKFVGLALAFPERNPAMFEYFLNHANHKPGIPLDMISYHFYATPTKEQTAENWQYSFFDQADKFLVGVRFIESIRKRLSPETKVDMDEVGSILPTDWHPDTPYEPGPPIPAVYWQASGAVFAYLYLEAAKMGIDVVSESQLVGYESQFPSVTMVDSETGKPNARLKVLRLLRENVSVDDRMIKTKFIGSDFDVLALDGARGKRLVMVNKRNRELAIDLPQEFAGGHLLNADELPAGASVDSQTLKLAPFAVVVVAAR